MCEGMQEAVCEDVRGVAVAVAVAVAAAAAAVAVAAHSRSPRAAYTNSV